MQMNEALGADRGHNCLGESDGLARRFRLHCNKARARGSHCELTDLRVPCREPVNEFLGRGLQRRIIFLPGEVRCGLGHLAVHFFARRSIHTALRGGHSRVNRCEFLWIRSQCAEADLQFSLLAPVQGSLDALDQVVDFKRLPEQARRTRGRGFGLEGCV